EAKVNPTRKLTIYLDGCGMAAQAKPGGAIESLLKSGDVLALALRGLGETPPGVRDAKKPSFFGVDFKDAFLGIHLNRPLLGQRVRDLLSVIDKVREECGDIALVARGITGPIALHATALDPRIQSVRVEHSLVSWMSVAETPLTYNQLSSVVPGVLKVYDLPELAATLAPRRLEIVAPQAPAGGPVGLSELEKTYAACRDAYRREGAEQRLIIGV